MKTRDCLLSRGKETLRWIAGKYEFAKTDAGIPVTGVNYLVPIRLLFEGPLMSVLKTDTTWSECMKVNAEAAVPTLSLPQEILRSFSFSKTKTDHPHWIDKDTDAFAADYQAEPGYRIRSCQLIAMSAAGHDDVVCNVIDSGNKARLSGKLTSGPKIDQTRGWWTGEIVLNQINREFDEVIGGTP